MAYHETFWLVSGTAAPVFALTNAVAIGQSLDVLISAGGAQVAAPRRSKASRGQRWRLLLSGFRHPIFQSYVEALAAFVVNALVTVLALVALEQESDVVPPIVSILLLVAAMFLIAAQVFTLARAKYKVTKAEVADR